MRRLPTLLVALLVAGCGLGPGAERDGGAELRVTRDFGQRALFSASTPKVREGETVMRFLRSRRNVETRYGGRFVQAIDGLAGAGAGGRSDWFYWVNGIEASVGAAERELSPGDVVQWDHRRWGAAMRVPATVGAYPEPFDHGTEGKRLPVRVECEDEGGPGCRAVKVRLTDDGVPVSSAALGAQGGENLLRVVVGRWPAARAVSEIDDLAEGPRESDVFARFAEDGERLDLLGVDGNVARSLGPGSGLLAATADSDHSVVWLVVGVDERGVEAAARLLEQRTLRNAFAVAATPGGPERLPLRESAG